MEVWVLEWQQPSENENDVTIWSNEKEARKQACKEIVDAIANDFDQDDSDASSCTDDIDDFISQGKLAEAMRCWNDYQDNCNTDYAQYFFVTKKNVLGNSPVASTSSNASFIASSNGATCRGPCGQHNEYAQADKSDGTHICRQCSTFQHIFGTTP